MSKDWENLISFKFIAVVCICITIILIEFDYRVDYKL